MRAVYDTSVVWSWNAPCYVRKIEYWLSKGKTKCVSISKSFRTIMVRCGLRKTLWKCYAWPFFCCNGHSGFPFPSCAKMFHQSGIVQRRMIVKQTILSSCSNSEVIIPAENTKSRLEWIQALAVSTLSSLPERQNHFKAMCTWTCRCIYKRTRLYRPERGWIFCVTINGCCCNRGLYKGADKSLARPTSPCILFDG